MTGGEPIERFGNGQDDGHNGHRDSKGRFVAGCKGGPGNPRAREVNKLRAAFLSAISLKDLRAAAKALTEKALAGNVLAIRELLDRTTGRVPGKLEVAEEQRRMVLVFEVAEPPEGWTGELPAIEDAETGEGAE